MKLTLTMTLKVVPHSGHIVIESISYDDDDKVYKNSKGILDFFCHGWLQLTKARKLPGATYEKNT